MMRIDYFKLSFEKCLIVMMVIMMTSFSCGRDDVKTSLKLASQNRCELEKVLSHYKIERNYEKLKAAEFLIKYMPWQRSYSVDISNYYDAVDSVLAVTSERDAFKSAMKRVYEESEKHLRIDSDIQTITADYLISEIDAAFNQWRNGKWARHLDFDEFCNYLLPYKCIANQPLDDWRERLSNLARGDIDRRERECKDYQYDSKSAAISVNASMSGNYMKYTKQLEQYPIFRPETILKLPYGTCIESCIAAIQIQRSKGIPVSLDFTPQWPNRKYGHYWLSVLGLNHKSVPFVPFDIESGVLENRILSKVFRMTYNPNRELARRVRKGLRIPSSLEYIFCQDVTAEYTTADDVEVKLFSNGRISDNIYIATFNNQTWIPVDWGEKKGGRKALFHALGRNVLYMPVQCTEMHECESVGYPFFLDSRGNVTYIPICSDNKEDVCLYRKYPVYAFVYKNSAMIRGGVLDISDQSDFSNSTTFAVFPSDSLTLAGAVSSVDAAGRFVKFKSSNEGRCDMAELIFYNEEGVRLSPALIKCGREVHPNNKVNLATAINDDDPLTFFSARGEDDIWVGFDFGKKVKVSQVDYFRRSDGNNLYPGYEYSLAWWNGYTWELIDTITADKSLCFNAKQVPSGVLLLLTCLTTGTESRPFVYNGGNIIWY